MLVSIDSYPDALVVMAVLRRHGHPVIYQGAARQPGEPVSFQFDTDAPKHDITFLVEAEERLLGSDALDEAYKTWLAKPWTIHPLPKE